MDKLRISLRFHKHMDADCNWTKIEGLSDQDFNTLEAMTLAIEALGSLEYGGQLTVSQHNVAVAKMASDYFDCLAKRLSKTN